MKGIAILCIIVCIPAALCDLRIIYRETKTLEITSNGNSGLQVNGTIPCNQTSTAEPNTTAPWYPTTPSWNSTTPPSNSSNTTEWWTTPTWTPPNNSSNTTEGWPSSTTWTPSNTTEWWPTTTSSPNNSTNSTEWSTTTWSPPNGTTTWSPPSNSTNGTNFWPEIPSFLVKLFR